MATLTRNSIFDEIHQLTVTTSQSNMKYKNNKLFAGKSVSIKTFSHPPKSGLDCIMFKRTAELTLRFRFQSSVAADNL